MKIIVSVIVPVYNESIGVLLAHKALTSELSKHNEAFEIIFVDDGSTDDSFFHLKNIAEKDTKIKVLKLSTNCGSHMAIRAGLLHASGDCAGFIACDLQEPPELIYKMKSKLSEQHNIVWAVRNSRKDSLRTKIHSTIFYWLARTMVTKDIPPSGATMFVLSSKAVKALNMYSERNMTLLGLFSSTGFKTTLVHYEGTNRILGKSKWTLAKKLKLTIDFFVASSNTPIRMVSIVGIGFSLLGFGWTAYILLREMFVGDLASGWPALLSVILIGFGITNISLGIIAEYLWRTLDEARGRPRYIVEEALNFNIDKTN
ncbi:MAG: glycosyltransferase family 2 protein [Cytophagales bacterium]|nr:glycosyltransferase family 2 protein [Cytophagales bacterium]